MGETANALKALDEDKPDEALAALEKATGTLELILARDPGLALAPVDVEVVTYDLSASLDTVKTIIEEAEDYLEDGEIQKARRPLVANLASEIRFLTTNIPLATYPDAIKAVTPLIDAAIN
ncbi:MAG: YfdX family protein, partial [Chromatiaceae bacterium]|nr:YfdX family protein [Chromatiaceae bacterium]